MSLKKTIKTVLRRKKQTKKSSPPPRHPPLSPPPPLPPPPPPPPPGPPLPRKYSPLKKSPPMWMRSGDGVLRNKSPLEEQKLALSTQALHKKGRDKTLQKKIRSDMHLIKWDQEIKEKFGDKFSVYAKGSAKKRKRRKIRTKKGKK
tara:strand:+ start:1005 stop:1442 length:438 start_codon:yes stop_codon:yes gene_type:complete